MELILLDWVVFIFGAAFGSFLNVLVDRLPRLESPVHGRSRCENCGKVLAALDLIPIVSFILLSGRCRYCKNKIPSRLFFVEILCGMLLSSLFLYIYLNGFPLISFFPLAAIFFSLTGVFLADSIYGIIPDEFVVCIIIASVILQVALHESLIPYVLSATGTFAFFFLPYLITKGKAMGFGDIKLAFSLGIFLGFPNIIVGTYISFLTGALISLILIMLRKKKLRGDTIPFGPFMVIGAIVAYFIGNRIIEFII